MFTEPPKRGRLSYFIVTAVIFIASFSASCVVAGCCTGVALAPFHFGDGEFSAFDAVAATFFCAGFLSNPAIFAAFWSRHCRVRSPHVIVSTAIPWTWWAIFLNKQWGLVPAAWIAIAIAACLGLVFGYRVLRKYRNRFHLEKTATA